MTRSHDIPSALPSTDPLDLESGSDPTSRTDTGAPDAPPVVMDPAAKRPGLAVKPARKSAERKAVPAKKLRTAALKMSGPQSTIAVAAAVVAASASPDSPNSIEDGPDQEPMDALTGSLELLYPDQIVVWNGSIRRTEILDNDVFNELRDAIKVVGINTVPVLLRKTKSSSSGKAIYELIDGQLRLRACLDLGLKIQALVVEADQLSDASATGHMLNSNLGRQPHSPVDIGMWAERVLTNGTFPTARALSKATRIDESTIAKARSIASLPQDVLDSFFGTKGVQYNFAVGLRTTFETDEVCLLARAAYVTLRNREAGYTMTAGDVYRELLKPKPEELKAPREKPQCPECEKTNAALLQTAPANSVLTVEPTNVWPSAEDEVPSNPVFCRETRADAVARNQLMLDLDAETPIESAPEYAPRPYATTVVEDVLATQTGHHQTTTPKFDFPRFLPANAVPVIDDDGDDRGWVFDHGDGRTYGVVSIPCVGEQYREWLAITLSKLSSSRPDLGSDGATD